MKEILLHKAWANNLTNYLGIKQVQPRREELRRERAENLRKNQTVRHILTECVEMIEIEENTEQILNEDGRGIEWIKFNK